MSDRKRRPGAVARPPRSRLRRTLRVVGGLLAFGLTATLAVGVSYALANLEELKANVPRMGAEEVRSPIEQAADSAVGYARDVTEPAESDGSGPGYVLSAKPPAGVDGPPGRWCPANVIGYRIDPTAVRAAGSTLGQERVRWRAAFAQWNRASGSRYRFAYRGPAQYPVQRDPRSFPIDPALVPEGEIAITYAFAPDHASPALAQYVHPELGSALGFAGVGPIDWRPGPAQGLVTRGMVVLDARDAAADPHAVPAPYVHESGHALGLGHVEDPGQMMYAQAGSSSAINDGDRAGLARLLRLGCG